MEEEDDGALDGAGAHVGPLGGGALGGAGAVLGGTGAGGVGA
jgi:hypothetical protein